MSEPRERDTQSFKVSPQIFAAIIAGIIGALGGGTGTAAYFQQQHPPTQPVVNAVTRDEFERRLLLLEKQLDRVETKLDALSARPTPTGRR